METANEAGIKEKAILTIIAAEKASRSYIISFASHQTLDNYKRKSTAKLELLSKNAHKHTGQKSLTPMPMI